MSGDRAEEAMNALQDGVNRAVDRDPSRIAGLAIMFIVAEIGSHDAHWCCNIDHDMAIDLLRQIVEDADAVKNGLQ